MITEVRLHLSGELYGGDPRGLLRHLGLHARPLGNAHWAVWPNEERSFVSCRDLADSTGLRHRFDYLHGVPAPLIRLDDAETLESFRELAGQLAERMTGGSDIAAPLHHIQFEVMRSGTNQQLITAVRDAYENIGRWPVERTGEPAFPDCSAHLITATDLLIRRARLPAIMFRFDQDPDAMQTITSLNGDLPQSNQASARAVWPLPTGKV